ncbi:Cyclic nucleotide-gated ion channel 1 [Morella rubra]|uniref:Cyclic nucleotide-gated ion channel 1 n=1 Tax=Morella rubra TaxID=262757 RepID=A0A6A1V169_9ROSI|nr:Cyclic nucleotide-gated ion channel 1 [Morella rubra]
MMMRDSEEHVMRYCDQLSRTNSTALVRVKSPQVYSVNGDKKEGILHPDGSFMKTWHEILLVSCVLAVFVDPFFFYLPMINDDNKCIVLDKRLEVAAICFRLITDMIYVVNIVLQFLCPCKIKDPRDIGRTRILTNPQEIRKRYLSTYFVVDVLAILPIPQVVIPITFQERKGLNSLNYRKFLKALALLQYVPRIFRHGKTNEIQQNSKIYPCESCIEFVSVYPRESCTGCLWYFFSIEREMGCWYFVCRKDDGCKLPSSFSCADHGFANYTLLLNDNCPVQTPNTTLFDFGIFLHALQSDTVSSTDFLQKIMFCFWWGLKNLSSLGQNLDTSSYFWENCFAVMISLYGLLLFLYFIGNLQMYMQLKTSKQLKILKNKKERAVIKDKKKSIQSWINRNGLDTLMEDIMFHTGQSLDEKEDINIDNPFDLLPIYLKIDIKHHLSLPLLEKVPIFQNGSQNLLKHLVCDYLKHVYYYEGSYIVKAGEPLDRMLLITEGVIWKFASSSEETVSSSWVCLEKGQFCGEELLDWGFKSTSPSPCLSNLPISPMTLKTHTKVEAFVLTADDLMGLLRQHYVTPPSHAASAALNVISER